LLRGCGEFVERMRRRIRLQYKTVRAEGFSIGFLGTAKVQKFLDVAVDFLANRIRWSSCGSGKLYHQVLRKLQRKETTSIEKISN
jgi:hypothetical protein